MKIGKYFKKHLEDLFLHSKVVPTAQYQSLLDTHCNNMGKIVEQTSQYAIIDFEFEDKPLRYKLHFVEGKHFQKVSEVEEIIIGN